MSLQIASITQNCKDKRKIVTAVGRELLGFNWAIGTKAEATVMQRIAA
jgi:transposase